MLSSVKQSGYLGIGLMAGYYVRLGWGMQNWLSDTIGQSSREPQEMGKEALSQWNNTFKICSVALPMHKNRKLI